MNRIRQHRMISFYSNFFEFCFLLILSEFIEFYPQRSARPIKSTTMIPTEDTKILLNIRLIEEDRYLLLNENACLMYNNLLLITKN